METTHTPFESDAGKPPRATALDPTTPTEVKEAVDDVASSIEQLYRVGNDYLGSHAEERPYAVLGVAAGLGFVLGGGLASRLGSTLANFSGRMLLSHVMDGWLARDEREGLL